MQHWILIPLHIPFIGMKKINIFTFVNKCCLRSSECFCSFFSNKEEEEKKTIQKWKCRQKVKFRIGIIIIFLMEECMNEICISMNLSIDTFTDIYSVRQNLFRIEFCGFFSDVFVKIPLTLTFRPIENGWESVFKIISINQKKSINFICMYVKKVPLFSFFYHNNYTIQ